MRLAAIRKLAIAALCLTTVPAWAAPEPAVQDFLQRLNATIGSASAGNPASARRACTRLIEQVFDLDAMAPKASAGAWSRMSAAQKSAYRKGLKNQAAEDCAERSRDFAGSRLELAGVRSGEGGDRFVGVRGNGRTVVFRARGGSRLRAVDLQANGRSLVANAERESKIILSRASGNPQALIDALDDD